jgi:thiamine biosynthesis lipoprotein
VTAELANLSWAALGTTAVIRAPHANLQSAQRAASRAVEQVDRLASRFRAESELSRINAVAGQWTAISSELTDLVALGLSAAEATDGAVDPTLAVELVALGYDRDWMDLPGVDAACPLSVGSSGASAERGEPWRSVELRRKRGMIRLPPGAGLDLGATAKGRAADLACAAAHRATGGAVLVSLGGDVAVAGTAPDGEWAVGIADDHRVRAEDCPEAVTIRCGGLATSSLLVRRWWREGEPVHHVLDPRTGRPVAPYWRTASVTAATCADANVAATAALVLGSEAPDWLERRGLPARLVTVDGTMVRVAGWPA